MKKNIFRVNNNYLIKDMMKTTKLCKLATTRKSYLEKIQYKKRARKSCNIFLFLERLDTNKIINNKKIKKKNIQPVFPKNKKIFLEGNT